MSEKEVEFLRDLQGFIDYMVRNDLERLTVPRFARGLGMAIAASSLGIASREITTMAKPLLPDKLWELIEPLLPKWTPSPKGGQPPVSDRKALTGILFVLKTGLPWEDLPCEMNCGCGMTCWRRRRDWQARRHLGQDPQGLARSSAGRRQDRLVEGLDRQQLRAGGLWGRGHGQEPGGPVQARQQAPRDHRRQRHPAGIVGDGRQRQRRDRDGAHWSTSSPRWRGRWGTRGASPTPCRGTWPTTPSRTARGCVRWGSSRSCPRRGSTRKAAWGRPAGRWSGRWPGFTRTAGFGSATSVGRRSIRRSSPWPVLRSVQVHCSPGSVRRS